MSRNIPICLFVLCVGLLLVFSGCQGIPGKVTGGGKIINECGEATANFGFNADSCDSECGELVGHFNYVDKGADVKMNGYVVGAEECPGGIDLADPSPICTACYDLSSLYGFDGTVYGVEVVYRNTNPKVEGEGGIAYGCVVDNGEGANADDADMTFICVEDGPYAGYKNLGKVQGNIQAHECDDND